MKIIFGFIIFFLLNSFAFADENSQALDPLQEMIQKSSLASPAVANRNHFYLDVAGTTNVGFSEKGGRVGLGYRWALFGGDIRVNFGKTQYGGIKATSDSSQTSGIAWSDQTIGSEMSRPRLDEDSWSFVTVEPGIFIDAKIFPEWFPLLTLRSRVGLSFGSFTDQANAISFSAYLFTVEAALIEQLSADSRWAVSASIFWNSGNLYSKNDVQDASDADRHLPVNWIGSSFGLIYSF